MLIYPYCGVSLITGASIPFVSAAHDAVRTAWVRGPDNFYLCRQSVASQDPLPKLQSLQRTCKLSKDKARDGCLDLG
jgi:hypothetical protein